MQLLESHHQLSDCLRIKWRLNPIKNNDNQFELYLRLDFAPQQIEMLDGKVEFALRSAKLSLELHQVNFYGESNLDSELIKPYQDIFTRQLQWEIRHQPNSKFLQGEDIEIKLGIIEFQSKEGIVTAKVIVKPVDLVLTKIEGLWRHNISPNKYAILERKLALFLHQNKFNPYLSQTVFTEQKNQDKMAISNSISEEDKKQQITELKNLIQLIFQNPTDDFSELAKIADINPLTDLAGGDLIATNLSRINLNSANLQAVNLRGADLTDTDLSEANLKYARLNGADLSGAYLEGANLSYANLQSASLALANLIGANLIGANLTATNLQNTSLAQAQVKDAIFKDNLGLNPEQQEEFKTQGAIIN